MDETALYRPLLLRASGISKRFGALVALKAFDFDIPRHAIVSLIGPNGAGKTIFFNILTGMYRPDSGAIWFNGRDICGLQADQIAALGISRTFQNIRLFSNMTVLENVLVGEHCLMRSNVVDAILRTQATQNEEATAVGRAMELLDFVGLSNMAREAAKNLSYGDQRRLEMARAVAGKPALLLLDEPTAGMNPQETAATVRLIARLRAELNQTILLVEHDMKVVMSISDRVSVLDSGQKIAEGTPDEVRRDPRVVQTYLGPGLAGGVLAAIRDA